MHGKRFINQQKLRYITYFLIHPVHRNIITQIKAYTLNSKR